MLNTGLDGVDGDGDDAKIDPAKVLAKLAGQCELIMGCLSMLAQHACRKACKPRAPTRALAS